MKKSIYLLMLLPLVLVSCVGEPTTVTTTTTTQEVTTTGACSRSSSDQAATISSSRNADRGARTRIRLDNRLLAMDRSRLRLGTWNVDRPPKASRSLGGRPLGASSRRLGLDCWPLAVTAITIQNRSIGFAISMQRFGRCCLQRVESKISVEAAVSAAILQYTQAARLPL